MNKPFIEARHVSKFFLGVQVLNDVNLSFYEREVHGLIGENGAGKSTLIKILGGLYKPEKGEIFIDGAKADLHSPSHAASLGISVIHQEFDLIPQMTVAQNMYLGREPKKRFGRVDFEALYYQTGLYLDKVRLNVSPDVPVASLSVEQKQLLAIAKALSRNARFLIMDEPTAALNGSEVERLLDIARELRQSCGVIFISHHMEEVFEISDKITVLRDGLVADTKPSGDIDEAAAIRLMTGKEHVHKRLSGVPPRGTVMLETKNLSHPQYFKDISFSLREGEILGFVGLEGQGQRQILRAIYGDIRASGSVLLRGEPVQVSSPAEALALGIVFVPEERKEEGLCLPLSIEHNLTLATLDRRSAAGVLKRGAREYQEVRERMSDVKLSTDDPSRLARSLSGGNQQKVVIAKCLAREPSVLLFSEPTRGIDVGAKEDIYLLIRALADKGSGIIIVSGDLSELMLVCDRIFVIHAGRIVKEFPAGNVSRESVMRAMWGLIPNSEVSA